MTRKAGVARPGTGLAEDGRHLREVTSYARRGSRLTPTLQEVWDRNVVVDEVARLAATDGHRITVTLWDDAEYLRTEGVIALHRA